MVLVVFAGNREESHVTMRNGWSANKDVRRREETKMESEST